MNASSFDMSVSVIDEKVYVRIEGSGTMPHGPSLQRLFTSLHSRGYGVFCFDLESCTFMDSTFLGLIAKIALTLHSEKQKGSTGRQLTLFHPCESILRSFKTLHVMPFMEIVSNPQPENPDYRPFTESPPQATKRELAETSLAAHQTLMDLNESNVSRFKDVVLFLEEDLDRLKNSDSTT